MKLTAVSLLVPILAYLETASAQTDAGCAASVIFNQCLRNQDIYIKTCSGQDYTCLCKWHTTKLSCWDNCQNDVSRGSQEGLKTTFCSIAAPINATVSSIGSALPTASQAPSSSSNGSGSKSGNVASLSPSAAGPIKIPSAATAAGSLPSLGSTKNSNGTTGTNGGGGNVNKTSHSGAMSLESGPVFGVIVAVTCYWFLL
ncbi:hypothetical protein J3Q64DRAFT_1872784 [Phycomyces blakesleeanus]|uniref:Extracellular membrane protein CFEM domain-containing protein n=2 Tax=Phycomyces blakesleeanus TaxID=4837 RepID=A0A162XI68_PHYB8|nr:hypothetical protein PHYBLDRAFT_181034 [Phycomyces blakesleeanus NRRL 1555(-)]OAD75045.1 hypothetical protein PHYBLDRAFT_181034 [Phycomyces blakesleeanus NRRL 1555(-)]|eukprot:XP_018293085.1 hypothetical protein PHYBLDRAFT_181034 [Phycomyces blakesleeanus NRRL 1555(-)]